MIKMLPPYLCILLTFLSSFLVDVQASTPHKINIHSPASLISFKVKAIDKKVIIEWQYVQEINVSHYVIERCSPDMKFQAIRNITAKGGSAAINSYTVTDVQPLSTTAYYRLKIVNRNGTTEYTTMVAVHINDHASGKIRLYPNPCDGKILSIDLGHVDVPVTIKLFDIIGNPVNYSITESGNGLIRMQFTGELPTGMYVAVITNTHNQQTTFLKFTVQ